MTNLIDVAFDFLGFINQYMIIYVGLLLVCYVIISASLYFIYEKIGANKKLAFVPVINYIKLLQLIDVPSLMVVLIFVPYVNFLGLIVMHFIIGWRLGEATDKGILFRLGLMIIPVVFFPLLAKQEKINYQRLKESELLIKEKEKEVEVDNIIKIDEYKLEDVNLDKGVNAYGLNDFLNNNIPDDENKIVPTKEEPKEKTSGDDITFDYNELYNTDKKDKSLESELNMNTDPNVTNVQIPVATPVPEVAQVPVANPQPVEAIPVAQAPVVNEVQAVPVAQPQVAQAPVVQAPVAPAPVASAPVAQAPVAPAPVVQPQVAVAPVVPAEQVQVAQVPQAVPAAPEVANIPVAPAPVQQPVEVAPMPTPPVQPVAPVVPTVAQVPVAPAPVQAPVMPEVAQNPVVETSVVAPVVPEVSPQQPSEQLTAGIPEVQPQVSVITEPGTGDAYTFDYNQVYNIETTAVPETHATSIIPTPVVETPAPADAVVEEQPAPDFEANPMNNNFTVPVNTPQAMTSTEINAGIPEVSANGESVFDSTESFNTLSVAAPPSFEIPEPKEEEKQEEVIPEVVPEVKKEDLVSVQIDEPEVLPVGNLTTETIKSVSTNNVVIESKVPDAPPVFPEVPSPGNINNAQVAEQVPQADALQQMNPFASNEPVVIDNIQDENLARASIEGGGAQPMNNNQPVQQPIPEAVPATPQVQPFQPGPPLNPSMVSSGSLLRENEDDRAVEEVQHGPKGAKYIDDSNTKYTLPKSDPVIINKPTDPNLIANPMSIFGNGTSGLRPTSEEAMQQAREAEQLAQQAQNVCPNCGFVIKPGQPSCVVCGYRFQ